uniref:O-fucosyltransferase family protein n=1 Tax=Syphacia muris TaxID=451379 RepID=A0A158R486_9BILA
MNLKQMGCEPRRQILKYVDCTNAEDIQKFTEQFCYVTMDVGNRCIFGFDLLAYWACQVDFLDAIVDVPSTSGSNYFGDTAKNEDFGNVKLIEGLLQSSCTSKESRLYVSMYPPLDSELKYLRCLEDHLKKTAWFPGSRISFIAGGGSSYSRSI